MTAMETEARRAFLCGVRAITDIGARIHAPVVGLWDRARCSAVTVNEHVDGIQVATNSSREGHIILHFHGGAHCLGSVWTTRELVARLSLSASAIVVSVNYRLAPDHPYPAALEDALAAWRWVRERNPAASIALAGESAGGNLCFALMVRLAQLGEQQPVACATMSPWLLLDTESISERKANSGLEPFNAQRVGFGIAARLSDLALGVWERGAARCATRYCQEHPASDPLVSPLLAEEHLVTKFPPCVIHAAEKEPLAVDATSMAALCTRCAVPVELQLYPGSLHVFQAVPFSSSSKDSLERIGAFLEKYWRPAMLV